MSALPMVIWSLYTGSTTAFAEKRCDDCISEGSLGTWVRVYGLGFGFWGLGFGVWGVRFGFWGLGFGFWILGFGFWVLGFGFRV
jgi:hypothetical protein